MPNITPVTPEFIEQAIEGNTSMIQSEAVSGKAIVALATSFVALLAGAYYVLRPSSPYEENVSNHEEPDSPGDAPPSDDEPKSQFRAGDSFLERETGAVLAGLELDGSQVIYPHPGQVTSPVNRDSSSSPFAPFSDPDDLSGSYIHVSRRPTEEELSFQTPSATGCFSTPSYGPNRGDTHPDLQGDEKMFKL